MGITVVSQSSKERDDEVKGLFMKMKPLLLEGKSFNQALCITLGTSNQAYTSRRWYKDLLKYAESQGFYKDDYSVVDKSGLLNVRLGNYRASLTGHYWIYRYLEDGKIRSLSDIDLCNLERKVESNGLVWRVTNQFKAENSYKLNKELLDNKRERRRGGKRSSSGVKYVSKINHKQSAKGYYWIYRYKGISLQATSLKKLECRVKDKNINWIIIDEDLYNRNIRNGY